MDTDVLPILLAYRGGLLEHTWVRVDWEAKSALETYCAGAPNTVVTFPSQRELTMTMAMGSCRHGILRGADSCRGVAHINESLSDVNDIDGGEPVFGSYDDELRMIARLRHCASAVSLNRTLSGALFGTNRSLCSCA